MEVLGFACFGKPLPWMYCRAAYRRSVMNVLKLEGVMVRLKWGSYDHSPLYRLSNSTVIVIKFGFMIGFLVHHSYGCKVQLPNVPATATS